MLKAAAESGAVAGLKGFGEKTAKTILEGLQHIEQAGTRIVLRRGPAPRRADPGRLARAAVGHAGRSRRQFSPSPGNGRRSRRAGDVADESAAPMDLVARIRWSKKCSLAATQSSECGLKAGIEMDVRVVPDESYGAALQYFTGSKAHNIAIRNRAQERGLKINEYGVFRGEKSIAGRTEEEVYAAVDLPWIPPELREDRGEIELAEKGNLPKLIELADMHGDLHMHTTATDGAGDDRRDDRGRQGAGAQVHRHHRPLETGLDGQWPRCQAAAGALEGNRQGPPAYDKGSKSCAASNATFSKTRRSISPTTFWPRPTG